MPRHIGSRPEVVVEDLVRLRRLRAALEPPSARDVERVSAHLQEALGGSVATTVAARVLGVSHTAVARWLRQGELLRGIEKSTHVDLNDLVDIALRMDDERRGGRSGRVLAAALRDRVPPDARAAASEAGVEPGVVAAWIRSGFLRSAASGRLAAGEADWLRTHGRLARAVHDLVMRAPGVDVAVLFGSVARGDDHAESDVDLIVDGPVVGDVRAMARLRGALIERLGRPVELVSLGEARFAPAVLAGALVDGRPMKDPRARWSELLGVREEIAADAEADRSTYADRESAALAAIAGGRR